MSKFKVGDSVLVVNNSVKYRGVISKIVKGSYNKETNEYTLDKYFIDTDDKLMYIECEKKELIKVELDKMDMAIGIVDPGNKETFFSQRIGNVIVVGVRTEEKEEVTKFMPLTKKIKGRVCEGIFETSYERLLKTLKIGYSICHEDDKFDENEGMTIARRRALKSPMGELTTNNWGMLQNDQCEAIVKCEAEYINKHIHQFIK